MPVRSAHKPDKERIRQIAANLDRRNISLGIHMTVCGFARIDEWIGLVAISISMWR